MNKKIIIGAVAVALLGSVSFLGFEQVNAGYRGIKLVWGKVTQRVENVHEFPGHIACDSRSNSEIVIPIVIDDNLFGVLDIDSPSYSRFTESDQVFLEEIVKVLVNRLKQVKSLL